MQMLSEIFRDCSANVLGILQLLRGYGHATLEIWVAVYGGIYVVALL